MALLGRLAGSRLSLKTVADAAAYAALRIAWAPLAALPTALARSLLEGLGGLAGRVDRRHAEIIRANLSIAFPEWADDERARVVDRTFRNWGRIAAEVLHARRIAGDVEPAWVRTAEARVAEIRAGGTGVLVLTAHTGNIELLGRIWGLVSGRRITILHRPMGNRFVDAFLCRERASMNVATLRRSVAARDALRLVLDGGVLAAPLDQNQPPGRPGVFVDMFGRPAATATVLARISLATGAPVVPVFAFWSPSGPDACVGEPIAPTGSREPGVERDRAVVALTAAYTRAVEAAVRRHPDQWNWAHRRWKTRPPRDAGCEH